jgi:hypothetical protein
MTALLATLTNAVDADGGNSSLAVNEPAGLQSGELLLSQWTTYSTIGVTAAGLATGFSDVIATYGTADLKGRVAYRIADGSEGPTFTATMPTSQFNDVEMVRIVGSHATTPIDGSNSTSGTATSVNFPAVTTSSDYCSAFAFISGGVDLATVAQTPPAGWVLIHTWGTGSPANYNAVFWQPLGLSGASTGTANFAFGASNEYLVSVTTVAPASSTGIHFVRLAGQAQNLTSQAATPVDMPTAASIVADNYLIDLIACDNAGTNGAHALVAPTDTQSHSWGLLTPANVDPGAANAGATAAIARVKVVNAFTNGDNADVNFSPNTTAKAVLVFEATGIHTGTPLAVAETQVTQAAGTTLAISRTPTAAGQMVLGVLAIEGPTGDTFTPDVDNTDGAWGILGRLSTTSGTAASNQTVWAVAKIVTGTSAQTWNPTIGTARDIAAVMAVFDIASTTITGTVAVTLDSFTSSATGAIGNNGTTAVTLADFTPSASGTYTPPPITGTVAVTLGDFVAAASGSFGSTVTGTVAVTLGDFTPSASGAIGNNGTTAVTLADFTATASGTYTPPLVTGTVAVTLGDFVAAASGTHTAGISGTVAVTLGSFTPAAAAVVANGLFPVAISGDSRSLVDGHGNPWFGAGDTAWSLAAQLTTAEITTYLEDRAGRGVNLVLFNAVEHLFADNAPNNANNDPPFTGTAFQTGINDVYWDVVDHAVNEAARLGITLLICPAYLGFASTEEGWDTEIVAATNGNMTTYGNSLAARYGAYPNITWLIGHDQVPDATEAAREAALSDAIQSGTAHLVTVGGVEQLGSDAWEGSGVDYDFDTVYFRSTDAPAAQVATGWAASPTMPTGFFEGLYEGDGTTPARIRSMMYGPLCAGATYIIFGNNPIWQFATGWEAALNDEGSLDLGVFADFVASLAGGWAGMVPDTTDTFLTVGEGTGASRSSARFDGDATAGVLGVAYRPNGGSASLTFDLTEFTAVATVKIRKFDPSSAAYTTIGTFATSGTQAVSSLGTNAAGDGDWVIVFEQSDDRTGTVAVTLGDFTPAASGTSTPPTVTGTVAVTLDSFTPNASGSHTPPGVTGTVAVTLADFVGAASGTHTPPGVTGTVAVTLADFTSSASGLFIPAGSGAGAVTLDPFTSSATGTYTPPTVTGTVAVTLGSFDANGTGSFVPLITGTVAVTLGLFIALGQQAPIGGHGTGSVVWRDGGSGGITSRDSATATVGANNSGTGTVNQP